MRRKQIIAFTLFLLVSAALLLESDEAHAEWIEVWARGHGTYVNGSSDLRFFELNDVGPGYGAALGVEILQIDAFADLNFFPGGEMFNLLGLGFDIDLIPVDAVMLAPAAQITYYFAPNADSELESNRGFMARAGAQFEVELFPTFSLGVDGYAGGAVMLPDNETGLIYQASAYAIFRFGF